MLTQIPFEVPTKYATEMAAGNIVRAGALLKDSGTGKIVAHLQETGVAQEILSSVVSSPFAPLKVLETPAALAANVQLAQLKTMVEGLQILQFANLGATVAGIGISALGFALMNSKLNGLSDQISSLQSEVAASFREVHERELRGHYSRIHGLFNQADQALTLSTPSNELHRVAGALADEGAYFRGEVAHLIGKDTFDTELFSAMTRSLALCNAGRIECLVRSGELKASQKIAEDVAGDYNTLFDPITPTKIAHKLSAQVTKSEQDFEERLSENMPLAKSLVTNLRETQDAAMSKPHLIDTLISRGIEGPEYMLAIEAENQCPILLIEPL